MEKLANMATLVRKCSDTCTLVCFVRSKSATKIPEVEEQGGRVIEKCGCGRKRWAADGRKLYPLVIERNKNTFESLYLSVF